MLTTEGEIALLRANGAALLAQRDRARNIAASLEGELASLRQAIDAIHTPKMVPRESDPEEPDVVCSTCHTDWPCETKSFSDALDPANALDEFADEPEPF